MTHLNIPYVTAVVCAYNAERISCNNTSVLLSCLSRLVNQSYPTQSYEVLVIDDGSTDGTYNIISNFIASTKKGGPFIKLVGIRHGGLSVSRNTAIRISNGDIIAFIDQDAIPNHDWLAELIQPFRSGADYVGGRINLLNTSSWLARFLQLTRFRQFFGPKLYNHQFVGCNMALRKNIFDTVDGFHENFLSYGDESTLVQRIFRTHTYAPAPNAIVYHLQPEKFTVFIRTTWKSATLYYLSHKASGCSISLKQWVLLFEQFLIAFFPVALGIIFLNKHMLLLVCISFLAVIHRTYIHSVNRSISYGLIVEYGFIRGFFGSIIYQILVNTLQFIGTVVSPLLYSEEKIVPPMTRELSIQRSISSD